MPTSILESCTSLALSFFFFSPKCVCDFLATTYWSQEKIKRSLTFHCSDFLIIWTPLILASIRRARLCNAATVQEGPGTREVLDLEHPRCAKVKQEECKGENMSGGCEQHQPYLYGGWGSVGAWKAFARHQKRHAERSDKLGRKHRHINICCHWGCKTKSDRSFRTWPPYLHLRQPLKLHKKTRLNFEVETWSSNSKGQSSSRMRFYANGKVFLSLTQTLNSGPTRLKVKDVKIKEVSFVVCHILCDYGHSKSSFSWKTPWCASHWKTSLFNAYNSNMQKLNDWEKEEDVPIVV